MAPPKKTTPEQHAWLTGLQSKFAEYQKSKKVAEFWVELDRDWFAHWPEAGVAEAERELPDHPSRAIAAEALRQRKLQLKNWFNNRTLNKKKAPIKIEPLIPPTRSHQPVEVYSKQFYKEKVQALVKAEIEEQGTKKEDRLNVVRKLTQEAFDKESEDVCQEIFAQAASLKVENAKRKAQARNAEPDTSPEAYAAAIESVPDILDVFFRDLALRTGWAFSVLCGGPNPANGGRIQTISFHEGKNFLGASYKKSHISFKESVLKPYVEFLGQVYTPGECSARALPESADDFRHDDPLPDPQPPLISPAVVDMLSLPAPAASIPVGSTVSGTPPDSMALIDPTLRPATSPIGVSAATQAPTPDTSSTNATTVLHVPPLADATGLINTPPSFATPSTNGPPFVFPLTISFAPQDSIRTALHIPPAIIPVVSSPIPAVPPSALHPASPQGPFNTPLTLVPPSEPSPAMSLIIPPAPKAKKRLVTSKKKKTGKKPSAKATLTKARDIETSTVVSTRTAGSINPPNEGQQLGLPVCAMEGGGLQTGRGQRIRKAVVSKEVVPLTDDQNRNAKESERAPKKRRTG